MVCTFDTKKNDVPHFEINLHPHRLLPLPERLSCSQPYTHTKCRPILKESGMEKKNTTVIFARDMSYLRVYSYIIYTYIYYPQPQCLLPISSGKKNITGQKKHWWMKSCRIWGKNGNHIMSVSKNRGTPKWMIYNGKPYLNGWFGGTIIFGNTHINSGRNYLVTGYKDVFQWIKSSIVELSPSRNCLEN